MRFLIVLFASLLFPQILISAETRGLSVVAKDLPTNMSREVKLYNRTFAVIIGIDRYKNLPPDRQLKNAVNDAKGVQGVLTQRYQFDRIITLYDEQATKDRILEVLTDELPAQMGKDDALFVFWAGHGNQEKSDYGDLGYLIPFDGSASKIRKNITMAELRDTVSKKLPAKHIFYVMDACYSGLLTTRSVDIRTRRDLAYLKEITRESVRQVLTAGGKNEEALDGGPKGHSVFTGRFIELLESADDFVTANELQASIKERVYSDAVARDHTQTPSFGSLYGLGDFVFIPKQVDSLDNLTRTSAARQKELELLKKAEQEELIVKQKEQTELSKKQAEINALDKQIVAMKSRLGNSSSLSNGSTNDSIRLPEKNRKQQLHVTDKNLNTVGISHEEVVDGVKSTFTIQPMADAMKAMGWMEMPAGVKETHHISVAFKDVMSGKDIAEGEVKVKVKVLGPDKQEATKEMMGMHGHFGADFEMGKKGKYGVMCKFQLKDGKVRQAKFWYTVK